MERAEKLAKDRARAHLKFKDNSAQIAKKRKLGTAEVQAADSGTDSLESEPPASNQTKESATATVSAKRAKLKPEVKSRPAAGAATSDNSGTANNQRESPGGLVSQPKQRKGQGDLRSTKQVRQKDRAGNKE